MKHRESGFAIIIVVLMTLITLSIFVITLSLTINGSRNTASRETQSYQALLASESGINSFIARVKEGRFSGSANSIACWVQGTDPTGGTCSPATANLGTLVLGTAADSPRANVNVVATDPTLSTVTVRSVGRAGTAGTAAQATLTQQITLNTPAFLNVAPPAALTSCPGITTRGNSTVVGSGTENSGIIPNLTTVTSATPSFVSSTMALGLSSTSGWPTSITVADGSLLNAGSYIQLGTQTYAVTSKPSVNTLTIQPADALMLPAFGTAFTGPLNLIPMAVRAAPTATGTTSNAQSVYRLPVSDPTGVYVNDVLYFTQAGVTYGVTVTGKGFINGDLNLGYVDVTLAPTGAGASPYDPVTGTQLAGQIPGPTATNLSILASGTPVRRYIPSAMSAGTIDGTSKGAVPTSGQFKPGGIAGSSTVQCGDALFAQVFSNLTKANMYDLIPAANRMTSFSGPLNNDIYWLGPQNTPSGSSFMLNGGTPLNGSGILIVNGDLTINGGNFTGVVYVIGNFENQGNSTINGSVIVEGNVNLNATKVAGTMTIQYDPLAVLRSAKKLSPVSFALRNGTWSQQ